MPAPAPERAAVSLSAGVPGAVLSDPAAPGVGGVGARTPDEASGYGTRGNGIMRHLDVSYDHAVLVAGFSKSYSSLLAFIALPTRLKEALKVLAPPYLYSGPSPVASLATTLAGLEVNRTRGDLLRANLWRMTHRLLDALHEMGIRTPNTSGFPIVEVPLADHEEIDDVGRYLFEHGQYVTMAAYPLVPKDEVGFRIQVTAANTDEEIDGLIEVLGSLHDHFLLDQGLDTLASSGLA
jgi:8-amino-7-oxononanoate synthase